MFNQEIYDYLKETKPSFAAAYLLENPEQSKIKRIRIWPLKNKWFHHKKFDKVKKKFKPLEPILIEVGNSKNRHTYNDACKFLLDQPNEFVEKHSVMVNEKRRVPAFMKLNCKEAIAKRIGCSVRTVEVYLRGLVRLGILRVDNLGKGKLLYSAGYWIPYMNKDKVWSHKINYYMNQKIGNSLIDFYLRKPKK